MFALATVRRHTRLITLALLMLALLVSLAPSPQLSAILRSQPAAAAESVETLGPQPGEVFKDFMDNAPAETAICNSTTGKCGTIAAIQTRSAANVSLLNASRAESIFEYWGGHPGTTNQTFRINNGPWRAYPDIQGIPADSLATCYFRTPTNAIAAVPLTGSGAVRPSGNTGNTVSVTYNYQIGPQQPLAECAPGTNQYWGMMWVYQATTRIYYDPAVTTHATGTITSPAAGGTLSENPTITVSAQAPTGRTISRVDLIGHYLDYDWDGDGVMREWQYAMRRGAWERTIGTYPNPSGRTNASLSGGVYKFVWDTTWLPDQDQPIQLMARITDNQGFSYMTPVVSTTLNRTGRSVRMYNTWSDDYGTRVFGPPRNYGMNTYTKPRSGWRTNISIGDTLTKATRARFTIYTWSANPGREDMNGDGVSDTDNAATEVWVNSRQMWPNQRFGLFHDYSFDSVTFSDPRAFLSQGDNTLMIWSNRPNHKLEVLWPGPAVFVEYSTPPSTPNLSASNTTLSTNEDQALEVTLPVSNPKGAALSYSILTPPTLGTLSGDAPKLTYTPNANANGSDSFSFRVNDQYGNSAEATISINIQPLADPTVIILGEGALLEPEGRFQRTISISDPDSTSLVATVNYGDGTGDLPLTVNANGSANLDHQYLTGGRFTLTVSVNDGGQTASATAIINVLTPGSPEPTAPWALNGWRYRFPITANAGAYPRQNRVAEFAVNFTSALENAGGSGSVIPASVRVVEVNANGAVINPNVPYQFDPASDYNVASNARGSLLVLMSGLTPANTSRRYQVYFETSGSFTTPTFAPLVVVTNPNIPDYKHDNAITIETRDPDGTRNSTYYYSRNGGALISLIDKSNVDWISYSTAADSTGAYRGVPNAGPVYHPGFYNTYTNGQGNDAGSNQRSTTTIVREGPLRTIVRSISSNGQWESTWEFFPTTARMTMVRTSTNTTYWWLYEGTPGGTLDWSDRWVRADGTTKNAYDTTFQAQERFHLDLPGAEWVYFRAGEAGLNGRAIWLANHNDADQAIDMYRQQNDASGDPAAMTVFGFGRREYTAAGAQTLQSELRGQQTFSLGFYESAPSAFDTNTGLLIEGRYRDLPPLSVGQGERVISNLAPWAGADRYRLRSTETLTVAAPGVMANDNDSDGDPISIELTSEPSHGTLTFTNDGSFTYVPDAGFLGEDSFSYTASDGKNAAPTTTVTIVIAPNAPPTALASNNTTNNLTPLVVAAPGVLQGATDADGDPITAVLISPPSHGQLTLNPDGSYVYTPEKDFVGKDSFTFAANDGMEQSAPQTITLTVAEPPKAPDNLVFLPFLTR